MSLGRSGHRAAKKPKPQARPPARARPKAKKAAKQAAARKPVLGEFTRQVLAEQARLAPLLPDIDPHDLNLTLANMMRPIEDRLFFLLPSGVGHAF